MTIILEGVDPTTFNLVASIIAEVLQLAGCYSLCALLHLMVSIYMRTGRKIPIDALGPLPGGLIDAWHFAASMQWAWPAIVALFLFISEYATVIAFAGLGFTEVSQLGPLAPVLNLTERNNFFPYEAIGEPTLPFTASRLEILVEDSAGAPDDEQKDEVRQLVREEAMVASFLGAADAIAQGQSVFLEQSEELVNDPTLLVLGQNTDINSIFSSIEDSTVLYGSSSFLVGISLEIPLSCSEDVMEAMEEQHGDGDWMTAIEEKRGRGSDNWTTRSRSPNCTFTSTRASGIHESDTLWNSPKAKVTAYARVGSGGEAKILIEKQGYVDNQSTFVFPYEGLYLAKETNDFRLGRQVSGFLGVLIGDHNIPFESTVVSTGNSLADPPKKLDPEDQNTVRTREYSLVAKVKDEDMNCPKDPSGSNESVCMVTVKLVCETFGSEVGFGGLLHGYGLSSNAPDFPDKLEHNCVFNGDVEIVWGKGYSVDQQLLAAVAGVQSRNAGWALSLRQKRTLSIHSIPASLFMLGNLGSRASVKQVRSTTIDGIFVTFMCVPVCLCVLAGFVYLMGMRYLLPLPNNGGSLVELTSKLLEKQASARIGQTEFDTSVWLGESLFFTPARTGSTRSVRQKPQSNLPAPRNLSALEFKWNGHTIALGSDKKVNPPPENDEEEFIGDISTVNDPEAGEAKGNKWIDIDSSSHPSTNKSSNKEETFNLGRKKSTGSSVDDRIPNARQGHIQSFGNQNTSNEETPPARNESTNCRLVFFRGSGIYVVLCMTFCIVVAILAAIFIGSKGFRSEVVINSARSHTLAIEQTPSPKNESVISVVPQGCFPNNNELRAAITGHLFGSKELQRKISEEYGQFEDWCVDYVDDFSFVFAGLPRRMKLNASNWNVSGATKFAFTFYNYDFSRNVLDVGDWDVSRAQFFRGMFQGSNIAEMDLSQWDVSSGTDFAGMFRKASLFTSDLSHWDVSSGANFAWMFDQASHFNANLSQWDVSSGTDFGFMFREAETFDSDLSKWVPSLGSSFRSMFQEAKSFNSDLSNWDVSSGFSFSSMFKDTKDFESDLSQWDVSSSLDFKEMFKGAKSFNSDLSNWDVSSGINFASTFKDCSKFNSDISQWDVSSGESFEGMFEFAKTFNSDLSMWDVSSGTDFASMFHGAETFQSDLSLWDVSSGTNFPQMFKEALKFTSDLSHWDVSSGTAFDGMFEKAPTFDSDLSTWDVSLGVDFHAMFGEASNFHSDISQWDVSSGTVFHHMFDKAIKFHSDLSHWEVSSGTDFSYMFRGTTYANLDVSAWDVSSGIDFGSMFRESAIGNIDLSQWDVSSGMEFEYMFRDAKDFNSDLSKWDVSKGEIFTAMFRSAESFNGDISKWDVSSGIDFHFMLRAAESFNGDLSDWDVSSGIDFSGMFRGTRNLHTDVSKWDVSSGTDFSSMFRRALSFNSDLSKWDVSSGIAFGDMFNDARSFNSDISEWDVSSGEDFSYMFSGAKRFTSDISEWDVSSGVDLKYMLYGASSFNSNLCSWLSLLDSDAGTKNMFELTGCPFQEASNDSMCGICSPTSQPSSFPSQSPTTTTKPTVSTGPTTETSSPSPPPSMGCTDTPGWVDTNYDGCDYYELFGCEGAQDHDRNGVTAFHACCTCGGGSSGNIFEGI